MKKGNNDAAQRAKPGRNKKSNPAKFRCYIRFNEIEYAAFLARFDESGMKVKAHFIIACIFRKPIRVIKLDKAAMDYYMRLTTFYSQFRAIGGNYNQVVKAIHSTFSEKKALAYLAKLEKITFELVILNQQIMDLTQEFEAKLYGSELAESTTDDK